MQLIKVVSLKCLFISHQNQPKFKGPLIKLSSVLPNKKYENCRDCDNIDIYKKMKMLVFLNDDLTLFKTNKKVSSFSNLLVGELTTFCMSKQTLVSLEHTLHSSWWNFYSFNYTIQSAHSFPTSKTFMPAKQCNAMVP